jgi:cobalt-zinc-cadmium efflux system membrane fusion protein
VGHRLLELAKNRDRARSLSKIGGTAVRDLQQAETDYVTADVEHHRADARLRQIGVNPEATDPSKTLTITAPIAGSIIELHVGAGAFWHDPNASLMTVADLSSIWVTANVPEKDTALISKGQAVEVVFAATRTRPSKARFSLSVTFSIPTHGAPRCGLRSKIPGFG